MIHAATGNQDVPGVVVGVGSDVPARTDAGAVPAASSASAGRSRSTSAASTRTRAARSCSTSSSATPRRSRAAWTSSSSAARSCRSRSIRGSITSASCPTGTSSTRSRPSDLLIMPSYFESLSMVALEAWALGRPVLANGRCDVLKGQCIRSNAGLYYETLRGVRRDAVLARVERPAPRAARTERPRVLHAALRVAGDRAEVSRHVRSVEARGGGPASRGRMEPLPGWLARRRRDRPAAAGSSPDSIRRGHARPGLGRRSLAVRMSPSPPARRASTRCSPRSATATPSATRCSASSGSCARAGYESEIFVETADPRLEDLTHRLPRDGRRRRARRRADPPFLDRLARVADGVRAAGPDGARVPQHHAAGVLPRRPQGPREAVLPRTPRADGLHRPLRAGARRLRVQPAGARGARFSHDRRAARSCRTSRTSTWHAGPHAGGRLRRRVDERACSSDG